MPLFIAIPNITDILVIGTLYNWNFCIISYTTTDWIDITEDGTVYVNGTALDEPYIDEKALGECDIDLPYQVPESRIFVMGDHRSTSIDSRTSMVGCIADEYIIGRLIFRVWPFEAISPL